ncbi:unnamed protein product [Phytomonas sp. EM1]|nr:unnamed protein product [Phytomonas sp. EM1]|eukprot:CCW65054.1 unnamed protein product [Phytomonas sp. isolate EM1]
MSRGQAFAVIEARQRREAFMREFEASQASELRQKLNVEWELKGNAKIYQKELFRVLDKVEARHNDTLVERRKRLADLLCREQAQYDHMLANLTETDGQRRERLIRKAKELRARREEERRADIAQRTDRLFREKIDQLREAESRLKVMQVSDARFSQLEEAKRRRENEAEEDAFFAQQAMEAQRLAIERTQRDLEVAYVSGEKLKRDLAAQVEGNAMRKSQAAEEQQRENEEFKRLVHEEHVQEMQKRAARRQAQCKLAQEMKELNETLQRARKEEYDRLQQEDKELLDSILAELAEEKLQQQEAKREAIRERQAEWDDLQRQLAQVKHDEHANDQLWVEANNREWEKREARWRADQAKRDELLRHILEVRRQQVREVQQRRRDDAAARKRDYEEVVLASTKDDGAGEAARQRRARAHENQDFLREQINQRAAREQAERMEKQRCLTDQQSLVALYKDSVEKEIQNLETAKPARYKDVPLLPPHQRNRPF